MSRFSSSSWSGGYQCRYVMNLIQAFPLFDSDDEEALSVVCERLGDAPETTTAFSGILTNFAQNDRSI